MLRSAMLRAASNAGAEIEFVGATSNNGASSLSLSGLGLQQGDLVVAVTSTTVGSYSFSSSGWTGVNSNFPTRDRTNSISYTVCYKEMGATPDTSFALNATVDFLGAIAFRNAQWASITSEASGTTISSFTASSITISTPTTRNLVAGSNFTVTSSSDEEKGLCCPPTDTSPPFNPTEDGLETVSGSENLKIDSGDIVFDTLIVNTDAGDIANYVSGDTSGSRLEIDTPSGTFKILCV